ncbi:zinc finger protein 41 homolog [Corythoichthys intestinalis]|uniref:zinc finger protein 41 homolog n=1 Tax=Corythoichthys intestinalis TaxID=161448 RepID=UPI0025A4E3FB|nr:zinc finger protein 41 homolog [Corythoichthys intestinalis]
MLKDLVRERLIAVADEIFELFGNTIVSYEEQLSHAKVEIERQRRQLEAVCKTQIVVRVEDVQQLIDRPDRPTQMGCSNLKEEDPSQLSFVKEEKMEADVTEEKVEADVKEEKVLMDDGPPESSKLHHESPSDTHCGRPPPEHLLSPLSHRDGMEESSSVKDNKHLKCSAKDIHYGNKEASQTDFNRHIRKREKAVPCSICGRKFSLKNLKRHMKNHTGEMSVSCSVCGIKLSQKENLKRHMRKHTGEKPYVCSLCGKAYSCGESLATHMMTHFKKKPYPCTICSSGFAKSWILDKHMKNTHGRKTLYLCRLQ